MKARGDASTPPTSALYKPLYVLQMNWWHWSDANRLKWLKELRGALGTTQRRVNDEIQRLERRT